MKILKEIINMRKVGNNPKVVKNAKGYSLWLMPGGEIYTRFANLIKRLAKEYNAPVFEPHITLLGQIVQPEEVVIEKTRQLALGQKPFPITLTTIDYQSTFFRTLFIKVNKTEPLLALHNQAKKIFEMKDVPEYMPHLSLLYGIFSPTVKERIIQVIGRNQTAQFEVGSIYLFKTRGEADTWYWLKEFPFF